MTDLITLASKGGVRLTPSEADANVVEIERRTAVGWQNLNFHMDSSGVTNGAPKALFLGEYPLDVFPADADKYMLCKVHMPHDIANIDLYPHIHFATETTSTGTVKFKWKLIYANEYSVTEDVGTPTADQIFGPNIEGEWVINMLAEYQGAHLVAESATPLSLSETAFDGNIVMLLWRDTSVAGNYPDQIFLTYADAYYQSQGFGTAGR